MVDGEGGGVAGWWRVEGSGVDESFRVGFVAATQLLSSETVKTLTPNLRP